MGLFHRKRKVEEQKPKKGTVARNAQRMQQKYPLTEHGYFGEKGKGNSRVIYSNNHIKEACYFYSQVSKGGKRGVLSNGHGEVKTMKDGGKVIYRKTTSTPNSPAVNLGNMKGKVKNQKIHFEVRRMKNGK